jgi:AcrR family transcriptional regulator
VEDWLAAGYTILAEEGVRALKIERLCEQIGATKGSFYWHFDDIHSYRAALVSSWSEFLEEERGFIGELAHLSPRERLSKLMTTLVSPRQWVLERAMREWARTDPTAAGSVRAADRRVVQALRQAYRDHGFSAEDADLRAESTFVAGVGSLHVRGASSRGRAASQREAFLDLMLRR